jgi:hypothetical protein
MQINLGPLYIGANAIPPHPQDKPAVSPDYLNIELKSKILGYKGIKIY